MPKKNTINTIIIAAIFILVTLYFAVSSGGDAMLITMDADSITFSGIDDCQVDILYTEIASTQLFPTFDVAQLLPEESPIYYYSADDAFTAGEKGGEMAFVTKMAEPLICMQLTDGRTVNFNYNNTGNTTELYQMLLEKLG